ncbi:alkaline phosphatase D family protein [Paucibacter sp. APW11]|uniref:Alkaline phosphatase D family protein n=1 Tax=Roseateles aquae TaxID=3077235 RepID=A0ABU3PFN9_9BURK|nr:alkaline phosphatase D family protein [Paucibacter sp. APW11]MDT9001137.1 alkaline phosphatase D family protein [Paucibacter sp. APW11]
MTAIPKNNTRRQLMASGLASSLAPSVALTAAGFAGPARAASRQPGLVEPSAPRLRIAFGSCARQDKPQPIWQAIAAKKPDLFLFLGDNFYADARDEATLRQRYAEFRAVKPLQDFRRATPHLAIWDDHDFGDDDVGADYALRRLSQQLFCDEWAEPADSPRRSRSGIYESYRFKCAGKTVQLIMLDLRFNRSPLVADPALQESYHAMVQRAQRSGKPMKGWYVPNPDPAATLLGAEQWAWLEQQLREPADVRLIGSSVQFAAEGSGWEGWTNFPLERQRLLRLIADTRAEGVVFLSGDMHYAELSSWEQGAAYPLWDITSSGLTEVWEIPTPNSQRRSAVLAERNFGLVDIELGGSESQLRLSICDVEGRQRLSQTLALSALKFPAEQAAKKG